MGRRGFGVLNCLCRWVWRGHVFPLPIEEVGYGARLLVRFRVRVVVTGFVRAGLVVRAGGCWLFLAVGRVVGVAGYTWAVCVPVCWWGPAGDPSLLKAFHDFGRYGFGSPWEWGTGWGRPGPRGRMGAVPCAARAWTLVSAAQGGGISAMSVRIIVGVLVSLM